MKPSTIPELPLTDVVVQPEPGMGPSDTSDTASDVTGVAGQDPRLGGTDTDSAGTGERTGAGSDAAADADGADIRPDVVRTRDEIGQETDESEPGD